MLCECCALRRAVCAGRSVARCTVQCSMSRAVSGSGRAGSVSRSAEMRRLCCGPFSLGNPIHYIPIHRAAMLTGVLHSTPKPQRRDHSAVSRTSGNNVRRSPRLPLSGFSLAPPSQLLSPTRPPPLPPLSLLSPTPAALVPFINEHHIAVTCACCLYVVCCHYGDADARTRPLRPTRRLFSVPSVGATGHWSLGLLTFQRGPVAVLGGCTVSCALVRRHQLGSGEAAPRAGRCRGVGRAAPAPALSDGGLSRDCVLRLRQSCVHLLELTMERRTKCDRCYGALRIAAARPSVLTAPL